MWQTIYTGLHRYADASQGSQSGRIYSGRFWARVFLVLTLTGLTLYLLYSFGIGK